MPRNDNSFQGFLDAVRTISQEAEAEFAAPLAHLREIDQVFVDWLASAGKPKPPAAVVLIVNAHASFRAASFLALSGQLLAVFMTLRGALESALYANAIAADPQLGPVWFRRDQDEHARQRCREAFTIRKMFDSLAAVQGRPFADAVRDGYDSTIDFGAHPNSRSIVSSARLEAVGEARVLNFVYAHGPRSSELRRSLVACAEIGSLALLTSLAASPDHPQAAALVERAQASSGRLAEFIAALGLIDPPAGD
ncbi:MAG: hypothetical protein L6Q69_22480 [Zoogloea sp.]|nr:hypothetical protein [Zoogloea sp.]